MGLYRLFRLRSVKRLPRNGTTKQYCPPQLTKLPPMRNLIRWNLVVCLAAACLFCTNSAEAYGCGNGCGIGGLYRSLDYPTERRVPYFAAHPPVYYSQPVPRTYGHSPFAYGPSHQTPEVYQTAKPVIIENPYVKKASGSTTVKQTKQNRERSVSYQADVVASTVASGPLMIENPYYHAQPIVH